MILTRTRHRPWHHGAIDPDPAQLKSLGVNSWPIWSCEVSTFPWTYDDRETCLLLEGEATVSPEGGEPVLHCTWQVHVLVREHWAQLNQELGLFGCVHRW